MRCAIIFAAHAGMMELADMRDLGSRAERRAGSTPVTRTNKHAEGGTIIVLLMRVFLFKE